MPRKRKAGLERRQIDPSAADTLLRTGWDFFGDLERAGIAGRAEDGGQVIFDEAWLKAAWKERRSAVMEDDRLQHGLFHRPRYWWRYEAEEDAPDDYLRGGTDFERGAQKRWLLAHPEFLTVDEKQALEAHRRHSNGQTQEDE
jgi:hypothetical protein